MLGSKLDIFKTQWLDVVFADRNKAYGAYVLRKENSRTTTIALLIGGLFFITAISSPLVIKYIKGLNTEIVEEKREVEVEIPLLPPPPIDELEPPPPPPAPPPPRVDQIRFPPPVVVPADQVNPDDEPPTVEDLVDADPSDKTLEGDPDADIVIDGPTGEGPKQSDVTEDGILDIAFVEVTPEFPGGLQKFYDYFGKNYKYPAMARQQGVSGRIALSFVVEKDGRLTDIKILRDLGYGTGEEAVRVLKGSPPWKPGIQNGRPVRVAYTMPIKLNLQ